MCLRRKFFSYSFTVSSVRCTFLLILIGCVLFNSAAICFLVCHIFRFLPIALLTAIHSLGCSRPDKTAESLNKTHICEQFQQTHTIHFSHSVHIVLYRNTFLARCLAMYLNGVLSHDVSVQCQLVFLESNMRNTGVHSLYIVLCFAQSRHVRYRNLYRGHCFQWLYK